MPAPAAGAQDSNRPENDRPSRRVYTAPVPPEPAEVQPEAISRAYRDALGLLATGSPAAAASAVKDLEPQPPKPGEPVQPTLRSIAAVVEEIAAIDPEALLPAILLHVELFRRHRDAGGQLQIDHHVALIGHMATLYAQHAGTPEARAAAADVLAAVGLALLEDRRRTPALAALTRAVKLDPTNVDALRGLAGDRERVGAYPDAVQLLEQLVAVQPDSAERVRLGINLRRIGRQRDATAVFESLVADPEAGWAATIAYQELARGLLAGDDPEGAAALLREAVERFPQSERLKLMLAYAVDRGGDPVGARQAVAALTEAPPDGADETPRRHYNRSPESAAALDLDGLRAVAADRLDALAAALDRLAAVEAGG